MKNTKHLIVFVAILFIGYIHNPNTNKSVKKNNDSVETAVFENNPKTFVYNDKVEITLPAGYYLEHYSIIYDDKNVKIGEFLRGLFTPLERISFPELLELYKNEGIIETKEGSTSFFGDEPDIIRIDSVQLTNYKWYLIINRRGLLLTIFSNFDFHKEPKSFSLCGKPPQS